MSGLNGTMTLKRWDADSSQPWSGAGRDSDLWVRHGDCLIYLRAKDLARRAPSFRMPFSALLAARCFPLIDRYLVMAEHDTQARPRTADEIARWYAAARHSPELLIPPGDDDAADSTAQYLAVRNFVAWVLKKPLVGHHLGAAYIALLTSMYELRSGVKDNVHDLLGFLKNKGYLDFANRPDYAVGALVFAETFRLRDVYLRAFAHCVGMGLKVPLSPEYQSLSATSKELLAQACQDASARLKKVSVTVGTLADDELSEAHLGIPPGVRTQLDRFRTFLLAFYSSKLGYYPPRAFDATVVRTMATDFHALYLLLQDDASTSFGPMPTASAGGLCTLQLVQAIDSRHAFDPLPHPLPLLPHQPPSTARRMSWLVRDRPDARQAEHAALARAANWHPAVWANDLVRAYRRFEADLVLKPPKTEPASLADARKVRWILVYTIHQALRHACRRAPEVPDEPDAPYLLAAPVGLALPWVEEKTTHEAVDLVRPSSVVERSGKSDAPPTRIEIVPDIDYFALTHRQRGLSVGTTASDTPLPHPLRSHPICRANSITNVLRRNSTLRRSVRRLKQAASSSSMPDPLDDVVILSYISADDADGRAPLDTMDGRIPLDTWAGSRSGSTVSSTSSALQPTISPASSITTTPSPVTPGIEALAPPPPLVSKFNPMMRASASATTRRPLSTALVDYSHAAVAEGRSMLRRHSSVAVTDVARRRRGSQQLYQRVLPHVIDEEDPACLLGRDSCDWNAMQDFLDGKPVRGSEVWEHYTDLGGLTELA